MAQALRHADEARAYVLTDEATFRQLDDSLDLEIVSAGDPRLVNGYAVLHRGEPPRAASLADWLIGEAGRAALGAFTIAGAAAFTPWPPDCPGGRPSDAACGAR